MGRRRGAAPSGSGQRRRDVLGGGLAALGGVGMAGVFDDDAPPPTDLVSAGDVVLFQGDSITDAGRSREHAAEPNAQPGMGTGYAWLAGAGLLVSRPTDDLRLFNRGISGNKVFQLAERWDADCLALKPDVLSILIGVNDIWHARGGNYAGTVEVYERDYHALCERTLEALGEVKLVCCEPFVLRCGAVDDSWFPEFDRYRAAARRVADAFGARWVPFHEVFERAVVHAPPEHWAGDGVHPSAAGAALMSQAWLRAVSP